MLHSMVTDVIRTGNDINGVICEHPGGKSMVLAKVVIDCTGEGEVAFPLARRPMSGPATSSSPAPLLSLPTASTGMSSWSTS